MPRVIDWGRREYGEALVAMRQLHRQRKAGEIDNVLVLVEHPPVVTVGVQGDDGGVERLSLPVFQVERGGHATYHGPGQLVGYPIVDLDRRGRDIRRFVSDVEEVVIRACGEMEVPAARILGRRGVWVGGERKVASVGIAVAEWVTFHGFALNVDLDLSPFLGFRPCGFDGEVMTSIAKELGRPVSLDEAKTPVVRAWRSIFEEILPERSELSGVSSPA